MQHILQDMIWLTSYAHCTATKTNQQRKKKRAVKYLLFIQFSIRKKEKNIFELAYFTLKIYTYMRTEMSRVINIF